MSVDWLLVARDGGILALGACTLIGALLKFNPRLFLRHFPEDLQRAVPPKTPAEKRHSIVGGIALLVWTLGILIVSAVKAEARGATDFLSLAVHTFAVGMVFNLAGETGVSAAESVPADATSKPARFENICCAVGLRRRF